MRLVFVHFLEEIEDSKKAFRNCMTFRGLKIISKIVHCGVVGEEVEDEEEEETIAVLAVVAAVVLAEELKMLQGFIK